MSKTISIGENIISLEQVEEKFNLFQSENDDFFTEWYENLAEVTDSEKQALDKVKSRYIYHRKSGPLAEGTVKLIVLSPLLEMAGFYDAPFRIDSEVTVQIAARDLDEIYRGRIDVLALQGELWILVVESKQTSFNIDIAIPQALSYMTASPNSAVKAVFGMITNGSNFMFLKLVNGDTPQYALSDDFSVYRRRNELYDVLCVLKKIGSLIG
ncbi:type I restriction endonuclease [Floridanema evergladense]|uniref:Type I restriction endonuclease n=1 Tax=Floridaenema evergladense BLCC-F167 TaxID=3153639 RepID=A0ABV4WKF3_9CYAN